MIGSNDRQAITAAPLLIEAFSARWREIYGQRV